MSDLQRRLDAWENSVTGQGVYGADKTMSAFIHYEFMSVREGLDIYRFDPVAARIAGMAPGEATRRGVDLTVGEVEPPGAYQERADSVMGMLHEVHRATRTHVFRYGGDVRLDSKDVVSASEKVNKRLNSLNILQNVADTWKLSRAGGQAALLLGAIDYTTDLSQPLDLARVVDFPWVTRIDPLDLEPAYRYDNPLAPRFNEVAIWRYQPQIASGGIGISRKFTTQPIYIHESRMIVFENERVYQNQLVPDSIFTRLKTDLSDYHLAYKSVSMMLSEGALSVYKYDGLAKLMEKRGMNALVDIMGQVDYGKSMVNATVLDKNDEYTRHVTPMSGYPDVLREYGIKLSTSSGMPVPLLIGISPGGLVTSGDGETRRWYDAVSVEQENKLAPALKKAVMIAMAAEGIDPMTTAFQLKFHPPWQPSEKEIAEAAKLRSEADMNYWKMKVLSAEEIAWNRFSTGQFNHGTKIDWAARAAGKPVVPPAVNMQPKKEPANEGVSQGRSKNGQVGPTGKKAE